MMFAPVMAIAMQTSLNAEGREHHCAQPMAQMDMNACAAIDFERADAELNRVYRDAVTEARRSDREIDRNVDHRPTAEAMLREAERAWVTFRDSHCTYDAYGEARGGSMEPMVYDGCRTELTRARIAQLTGNEGTAR
jgi:uncharacterized protein YecT (DUF1311 family)